MNRIVLPALVLTSLVMGGCTPMGAVSVVGSTLSRTIEKEQNRKEQEPVNRRIAFTNVNLGVEYMRQGAYEKALTKFERAKKADPRYPLTYNMLGVLYQLIDDPEAAEENFKHSLKLDEGDPSSLNNYGQFLCKQDRTDEAEALFLEAAANPFYTTPELAYSNAGSCAYQHDDVETAISYFQKSLQVNPEMPVALSSMSEIRFDEGDFLGARGYMQRYLEVANHTPKTLWLAIRIERHFGDLDKIASYSLLLRNKYPDTREAELLRISENYVASVKPQQQVKKKPDLVATLTPPSPKKRSIEILRLYDSSDLLVEFDLSAFPSLLNEKVLLGFE